MRFRLEAPEKASGLRLIEEIPGYPVCHIEGRNGVGKSLALRLLELATGSQPYAGLPSAWKTLRSSLGPATITVYDIDAKTLVARLSPTEWPTTPDPVDERFATWELDGVPIGLTDVSSLLRVIRIAGDETFAGTIRNRIAVERTAISRLRERFDAYIRLIEGLIEPSLSAISSVDPERLAQDETRIDQLTREISAAETRLADEQTRLQATSRALIARKRTEAMRASEPALASELQTTTEEIADAEALLRDLEFQQAHLLEDLARGTHFQEAMAKAQVSRDKRLKRVEALNRQVETLAAELDFDLASDTLEAAIAATRRDKAALTRQRLSIGHAGALAEVVDGFNSALARHRDLAPEVVAILEPDDRRLTASELQTGLIRRGLEVAEASRDPLAAELDEKIALLDVRLARLNDLEGKVAALRRAIDRFNEDEENLAALVARAEAAEETRNAYDALAARIREVQVHLRDAVSREAQLRAHLQELTGGRTSAEVAEDLSLALAELGLADAADLDRVHAEVESTVSAARAEVRRLQETLVALKASIESRYEMLAAVSDRLLAADWMPTAFRRALTRSGNRTEGLLMISTALRAIRESVYSARSRLDSVSAAADSLIDEVGTGEPAASSPPLVAALGAALGHRLRQEFDQPEIREALFDGGELTGLDIQRLEAHWMAPSGEVRSRPFEAFSSGEQVFAYTRARIARVAEVPAQHRVIALDEFGSFLARDRLERLAHYLRESVVHQIADQVIIVVPLAADYRRQADEMRGELHGRFDDRARQVEVQGYFVEDASVRELV